MSDEKEKSSRNPARGSDPVKFTKAITTLPTITSQSTSDIPSVPQEKPRHLEEETVSYLLEIESQFKSIGEDDGETKEILVNNVLTEIQTRTASAACDRRTNFFFEQLCLHANPLQLIQLLQRWTNYSIFLARNRYASHIVQTVVSRLCFCFQQGTVYDGVEENVVEETILTFSKSLLQEMYWLGKEMSASHVIRSLLCLLSGLPTIAEKKGKNSKHQHAVTFSEPLEFMIAQNAFYISHEKAFLIPPSFKEEVLRGFQKLGTKSRHDLQLFIADISSCALLTLLFKVIANPIMYDPAVTRPLLSDFLEKLFDKSIIESGEISSTSSDVFYAMAGDRLGSYFLETLITVFPFKDMVVPMALKTLLGQNTTSFSASSSGLKPLNNSGGGGSSVLREYCFDHFGNYVFQAFVKRMDCEYRALLSSPSRDSADQSLLHSLSDLIFAEVKNMVSLQSLSGESATPEESVSKDIRELIESKGGIFYSLLEMYNTFEKEKEFLYIATCVVASWKEESNPSAEVRLAPLTVKNVALITSITQYLERRFSTAEKTNNSEQSKEQQKDQDSALFGAQSQVSSQILLSRILRLFLLSPVESFSSLIFEAIIGLSPISFRNIINTSQVNKNIIDAIILAPFSEEVRKKQKSMGRFFHQFKLFSIKMTEEKMLPLFVQSFYGLKNIISVYEHCDHRGKEKWVGFLVDLKQQLQKSKDGRALLELCRFDLYQRDLKEWRSAVKKEIKHVEEDVSPTPAQATEERKRKHSSISPNDGSASVPDSNTNEVEAAATGEKKKRKRKRQKKNPAINAGDVLVESDQDDEV